MATINFYLDKPDAKGRCPIFLVCQHRGRKFKQFTKEKLLPKYWDAKKQRSKNISGSGEINDYLEEQESKLKSLERELRRTQPDYTFEDLKEAFKKKDNKKLGVLDFIDGFILEAEASHQKKSLKEYRTIYNDLKAYEIFYNDTLTYGKINLSFFNKYLAYLVDEKENGQNTIAKKISTLKTLLNYAAKSGHNKTFAFRDFSVKKIKTKKNFLTKEELNLMYHLDLKDNLRLERVRDIFCFGCFTGLRYSDISTLKFAEIVIKNDTDGEPYQALQFHVQKTKRLLIVPLNKYALEIIEKYEKQKDLALGVIEGGEKLKPNELVLPIISIQKMNKYIKEVAKLAGINTEVIVTKFSGSKRTETIFKKHQLLATHDARRTFSIISLENKMRVEVLQKILGHQSLKTTMQYIFILEEIKNQEMKDAWDNFEI